MGQQTNWTDISTKEIRRWWVSTWKAAPHYVTSGKCKSIQWDTTTRLSEGLKSKTLIAPNAGQAAEPQELSCINGKNTKRYRHIRRRLNSVSKYTLTLWSRNCAPWIYPGDLKNLCSDENLNIDGYSGFIHNI